MAVQTVAGIERTQMTIRLGCSVGDILQVMGDRCCASVRSRIGEVHAGVIVACIALGCGDDVLASFVVLFYKRSTVIAAACVAVGACLGWIAAQSVGVHCGIIGIDVTVLASANLVNACIE